MNTQPNSFKLPELSLWDSEQSVDVTEVTTVSNNAKLGLTNLTIVGDDFSAKRKSPERSAEKSNPGGEEWFLSKLASVCADSDRNNLVDNLVKQTCGIAGFGPMVSALEKLQ